MFDKAKLRDILGPRILEVVQQISAGPTNRVFMRVNGVEWVFDETENHDGNVVFTGPRKPVIGDGLTAAEKSSQSTMIVRFDHRCTRMDCNTKTCREHVDVLYAIGKRTGKVVLEIGTDLSDDYEPCTVFEYSTRGKTPDWMKP